MHMKNNPYSSTYLRDKKSSLKFKRLAIKRQLRRLGYSPDDLAPISNNLRALRNVRAEYRPMDSIFWNVIKGLWHYRPIPGRYEIYTGGSRIIGETPSLEEAEAACIQHKFPPDTTHGDYRVNEEMIMTKLKFNRVTEINDHELVHVYRIDADGDYYADIDKAPWFRMENASDEVAVAVCEDPRLGRSPLPNNW